MGASTRERKQTVRPATEDEVAFAVTGRRTRRTRPGEVERHIRRERQRVARLRQKGITAILRQANQHGVTMTRPEAARRYDETH